MKRFRFFAGILLAVCMLLLSPGVFAREHSGSCGENLTWTFADGTLTVSGTGAMTDFSGFSSQPWAELRDRIVTVDVQPGVTSIGNYAFYRCSALVDLSLPDGLESIGGFAFWNCLNLAQIQLPATVTTIGARAFAFNYALESITIPEGVTQISSYLFQDCSALTNIDLPSTVTAIGDNAFSGCSALTGIALPKRLKTVGEKCFYGTGLKTVTLPDTVSQIGAGAFHNCKSLTYADTGDGLTEVPKECFYECAALTEAVIGDSVCAVGVNAFRGCGALEKVTVGKSIAKIEDYAFYDCLAIAKVDIASAAGWCKLMLSSLYSNPLYAGNGDLYLNGVLITDLVIPQGVISINRDVFYGCNAVETLTVSEGVEVIGAGAFQNCRNLRTVKLPESLYSLGNYAFVGCEKLQAVTVPSKVVALPTSVFGGCGSLKTVTFLGNAPVIAEDAFYALGRDPVVADCYYPENNHTWLESIMLDYGGKLTWHPAGEQPEKTDSVTRIYGADRYETAFQAADQLKAQLGISRFNTIVVADGTNFADALSGSYLAAVKNAPILLVKGNKTTLNQVKDYIKANLAAGGTVYLLGGVNAVPKAMETGLESFTVKRLGGNTRYDTNLLILKEAGVGDKDILICTGKGFADSLSASAAELPILLVKDSLAEAQKEFLKGTAGKKYIIGGTGAVSGRAEAELKAYGEVKRLGGNTRYETSVLVAKEFFAAPAAVVLAYAQNFPDGLSGGALAAGINAPLILTMGGKDAPAAEYAKALEIKNGFVLGGAGLISDKTVKTIFQMAPDSSILVSR